MRNVILYIWQLPQNLLGLLLIAFYKGSDNDADVVAALANHPNISISQ